MEVRVGYSSLNSLNIPLYLKFSEGEIRGLKEMLSTNKSEVTFFNPQKTERQSVLAWHNKMKHKVEDILFNKQNNLYNKHTGSKLNIKG